MAATNETDSAPPDGISDRHAKPRPWARHASPFAFLVLSAMVVLAVSGTLGGGKNTTTIVRGNEALLTVNTPGHIRNGQFFETRIIVEAKAPIGDLVVALPPSLWRDLTINSLIPGPGEEEFADGLFKFRYGPFKAGERLEIKVANQINPALIGRNRGAIMVFDDKRLLARMPLTLTVLP